MIRFFSLLLIAVCSVQAKVAPAEQTCSIVYGQDWAFLMAAPDEWKTACHVEKTHGVSVALWQSNSEWGQTTPFMYITISSKNGASIEQFVDDEVSRFKANAESIVVNESQAIIMADKNEAPVRQFTDTEHGFSEFVAYADIGSQYIIIVLHAKTETELKDQFPAFNGLVQSIRKLTIKFERKEGA